MRRFLLKNAALIGAIFPKAFANANAGSTLHVCPIPQNFDLTLTDYELLDYVEIRAVGSHGEAGSATNILTYDTWDSNVIQKAKGMTDAGSPEIELARIPDDPGQMVLRAAALTNLNYAIKMVRNDPQTVNGEPTTIYNRGLIAGPRRPFGRNEDFDLEIFTFALNQREIIVNPTAGGTAPANTVLPAITGDAEVGELLTASTGTFIGTAPITYSYQWYAAGVAIANATDAIYLLTGEEVGKIITVRVRAENVAGFAIAFSSATAAVTA